MVLRKKTIETRPDTAKKPYKAPVIRTDDVAVPNLFCPTGYIDCGDGCQPGNSC